MPLGTDEDGTDDNEGPHCRNCHTGANDCFTCHTNDDRFQPAAFSAAGVATRVDVSSAYTAVTDAQVGNRSNWTPQASYRQSAVAGSAISDPCLDGGFSFPHRTLGYNMLKDELWGVDFDGQAIAAGVARTANGNTLDMMSGVATSTGTPRPADAKQAYVTSDWYYYVETRNDTSIIPAVQGDNGALVGQAAENLDSVCIDCHGDATYWNGDDDSLYVDKAGKAVPYGTYGHGDTFGWELLLKGLP